MDCVANSMLSKPPVIIKSLRTSKLVQTQSQLHKNKGRLCPRNLELLASYRQQLMQLELLILCRYSDQPCLEVVRKLSGSCENVRKNQDLQTRYESYNNGEHDGEQYAHLRFHPKIIDHSSIHINIIHGGVTKSIVSRLDQLRIFTIRRYYLLQ